MAQELSDLGKRCASTQQIGGEGVAEQVGPFELRVQAGALERAIDDTVDGAGADQATQRRPHADKDPPRRAGRTNVTQIVDQRRTDVRRQRQSPQSLALASDYNLTALPVQILQGQGDDLPSAQPQTGQEQQDRIVPLTDRRAAIAKREHLLDLSRRKRLGQVRQAPVGHPRHRASEIGRDRAPLLQKAQKRAQCGDHQLSPATASRLAATDNEAMNIDRAQLIEPHRLASKSFDQKASNNRQIVVQGRRREATLRPQVAPEVLGEVTQRGPISLWRAGLNATEVTQVSEQLPPRRRLATPHMTPAATDRMKLAKELLINHIP